jgi:hypothetical protein
MKPVVAFSLFGYNLKYYVGAEKNIQQIKEMLPDWEVKIYYHDESIIKDNIQKLIDLGGTLVNVNGMDICNKPLLEYPLQYRIHMFILHQTYIKSINNLENKKFHIDKKFVINYVNNLDPALLMFCLNYHMRKRNVDIIKNENNLKNT